MCKNIAMEPMKKNTDSAVQKSCKPTIMAPMWQACRRALKLEHSPPHQFACCQWQKSLQHPSTTYLIYRWLLFLAVVSIGVASFSCQRLPPKYNGPKIELNYFKWFIYFTNWGFLLIMLQSGLALLVVHRYRADKYIVSCEEEIPMPQVRRKSTPLLCRAYWLAHNIATDLAFVISLVYWTLIHDPNIHEVNTLNILVHGGNSVVMLVELAVTAHPVRAAHALYSASAGLTYGAFSAFYWAIGGTDRIGQYAIYSALDWNKPGSAIGFVSLCALVLVFAHAFATCCVALRSYVARRTRINTQRREAPGSLRLSTR